jgi:hypothetical protein
MRSVITCLPDIVGMINSRRTRWAGHVKPIREIRNACKFFVGKSEGKGPLGRGRR